MEGVELGGAGPTKSMSDWSMTEARTWLTRYGNGTDNMCSLSLFVPCEVVFRVIESAIFVEIHMQKRNGYQNSRGCDCALWSSAGLPAGCSCCACLYLILVWDRSLRALSAVFYGIACRCNALIRSLPPVSIKSSAAYRASRDTVIVSPKVSPLVLISSRFVYNGRSEALACAAWTQGAPLMSIVVVFPPVWSSDHPHVRIAFTSCL